MRSRQGDAACETRERRKRADDIRVSVNLASSAHSLLGLLSWAGKNMQGQCAAARAIERYMLDAWTLYDTALKKHISLAFAEVCDDSSGTRSAGCRCS